MKPANKSPAIKIRVTVNLDTLLFLIARKYTKGAVIKRSANTPFDNSLLLTVNFGKSVIKKQLKKIKKGIPKAIVQLGLFVVDIVIIKIFCFNGS